MNKFTAAPFLALARDSRFFSKIMPSVADSPEFDKLKMLIKKWEMDPADTDFEEVADELFSLNMEKHQRTPKNLLPSALKERYDSILREKEDQKIVKIRQKYIQKVIELYNGDMVELALLRIRAILNQRPDNIPWCRELKLAIEKVLLLE